MQFQSEAEEAVWFHALIAFIGTCEPGPFASSGMADDVLLEYRKRRPEGGYIRSGLVGEPMPGSPQE